MKLKDFFKSKKTKNTLYTIMEILVVAGIIFGAMMFVYNRINKGSESGSISKVVDENSKEQAQKNKKLNTDYYIEVNLSKNAMVIYEYNDKKHKKKTPVKVFNCSIGKELKTGSYKTKQEYQWIKSNGSWHQYNTNISKRCWIQSINFSNKYPYTMDKKSYDKVGKKVSGSSVLLYSGDASWIYENCKNNTVVKVIKGKKSDTLPLTSAEKMKVDGKCGWDPTDTSKDNPYSKIKPGSVVIGKKTVYIEKGAKVSYFSNLLALDETGKSIAKKWKYKKIDSDSLGKHTVKFSVKTAKGKKLEVQQDFKVVDTTCPKVDCSKLLFTLEVDSRSNMDLNNVKNLKKVENMVRPYVSCNEEDCKIEINTVNAGELNIAKFPIIITATDQSGNIGSCQVMLEVKLTKKAMNKSGALSKKEKESLEKRAKENAKGRVEQDTTEEITKKKEKATQTPETSTTTKNTTESK